VAAEVADHLEEVAVAHSQAVEEECCQEEEGVVVDCRKIVATEHSTQRRSIQEEQQDQEEHPCSPEDKQRRIQAPSRHHIHQVGHQREDRPGVAAKELLGVVVVERRIHSGLLGKNHRDCRLHVHGLLPKVQHLQ
jgi:hypothetical protein